MTSEAPDQPQRSTIDELGIKRGMRVRMTGDLGDELKTAAKARLGASLLRSEALDLIVRMVSSLAEADEFIARVRPEMVDSGTLWIATWNEGDPRYVDPQELVPIAKAHGMRDDKLIALDPRRSAMRFVAAT